MKAKKAKGKKGKHGEGQVSAPGTPGGGTPRSALTLEEKARRFLQTVLTISTKGVEEKA